jgi:hypothetical protein
MDREVLPDPRFTTNFAFDHQGSWFHRSTNNFQLPASVNETWCRPGYQPKRDDKGYKLTVNDYPFHSIQYGGPAWSNVVHTPFQTDN